MTTHGGARKGAGRPRRQGGRHLVQVVLDDATHAIWKAREGDRSAWVRELIAASALPAPVVREDDPGRAK